METLSKKKNAHLKRKKRVRKKIQGLENRPRMSVFRSASHIYAQIIVDTSGRTLVQVSSLSPELKGPKAANKVEMAKRVGALAAQKALAQGISQVVFDRNGFLYHGRIKAVSDGAREGGLIF
ncbi:MAG: 50S ribosomal protein L18 [Deltaproteobacteria bacterium]|nr:50S ribosomal protein L18 [Deltaproteobacteria bacterium]